MIPDPLIHALWLSAGAAAAWRITALHYRARLTAMTQSRDLYCAWWERDSARAITAEAEIDLTREHRRMAGRQSHKAERALIAATTEKLRQCVELRKIQPAAANPALGFPAAHSAASITGGRGRETPRHHGQDTGAGTSPDATQRARAGNKPGQSCRRNRAGNFAPAETPKQKGA
jgi:hypothetical protein